ncbi:RNA polymerase sigma-70 factor (ECF subfamily) [Silvibacterium bohemicum]|uniref:RNA polymerase sigma-70 factor (ECF subfamily) n=1 Tax=Silvibacterium bohemicum TaxID=1577686 RepID=A0A841JV16_9BACT|nr:RNA polymerase sigma-70 factor (ECF subfamily) [Silvibacterium bohemicum]
MESRTTNPQSDCIAAAEHLASQDGSGVLVLEDVAEFYASRRQSLFGQAFAMVRNRALAEDLTQEAFAKLIVEVKGGGRIQSAVRWTSTVLRNLALNHLEHRKVSLRIVEPDSQAQIDIAPDDTPSAEQVYIAKESRMRMQRVLSILEPLERECVLMFAEGHSYKEIASQKDLTYGVAVDVVRRSLRKLRKRIPAIQG